MDLALIRRPHHGRSGSLVCLCAVTYRCTVLAVLYCVVLCCVASRCDAACARKKLAAGSGSLDAVANHHHALCRAPAALKARQASRASLPAARQLLLLLLLDSPI